MDGTSLSQEDLARLVCPQLEAQQGHGGRATGVLLGMLVSFALAGLALWAAWGWLRGQLEAARRQNAAVLLEKLDGAALKRVCGNANLPAWARYPDFERVQWLNDLISQLWPNVSAAASGIVRERIDPLMREAKPAWIADISIHTFTLGDTPLRVSAVKVFNTESVIDEIGVEVEFLWNGAQRFQLAIRPFPRLPVGLGLGAALSRLLAMRVGVSNVWFKGRVRVAMKPLLDRVPLVGAVKVSLVEPPDFNFRLQLQGGDVTLLPGLETWLAAFIKDVLLQPYVLPEGVTVPIDPNLGRVEVPRGILHCRVLGARNLPWLDWLTLPDPYVRLFVRGRRKQRTQTAKRTFNPTWDEEFMMLVHDPEHQALSAVLYDADLIGADKEIGRVRVPISELPAGETQEGWHEVQPPEAQRAGSALGLGLRGVQRVGSVVREAVHLPFSLGARDPPQLRLALTYHRIGEAEVRAATRPEQAGAGSQGESSVVRMLRGGVLLVTVRKGVDERSPHGGMVGNLVTVRVGGQEKGTAATYGEKNYDWEEVVELPVSGEVLDDADSQIEVRVWDYHWSNHLGECLTWERHAWEGEGLLHIPLSRVVSERQLDDTFPLENVSGEVELVLKWLPMLETPPGVT